MSEELDKKVASSAEAAPVAETEQAAQVDLEAAAEGDDSSKTVEPSDTPAVPPLVVVDEPEVLDDGRTPTVSEK